MKKVTKALLFSGFLALFFNMAALEATKLLPSNPPQVFAHK